MAIYVMGSDQYMIGNGSQKERSGGTEEMTLQLEFELPEEATGRNPGWAFQAQEPGHSKVLMNEQAWWIRDTERRLPCCIIR